MPESSSRFHEAPEALAPETRELHRAVVSLIEELEAVDWYSQRAEACGDDQLRSVLIHNRDEEVEHAAMTLEWIRRQLPTFDSCLRRYLFREGDIVAAEHNGADGEDRAPRGVIGVGSLRAAPLEKTTGGSPE